MSIRHLLSVTTAAIALAAPATALAGPAAEITRTATLPDIRLSALQPSIADDRLIQLGGIGSGLQKAAPGEFWAITDRGPNGRPTVSGQRRRTFPVPDFTPAIVRIGVSEDTINVLEALPLRDAGGALISGRPNLPGYDERPWNWNGTQQLAYDPEGLDTEGVVQVPDGTFWIVDEYSPSIVQVDSGGRILRRLVPAGLGLTGTDHPVAEAVPAIYRKRKQNRGFEGIAASPDGRTLYVALQSPLGVPTSSAGENSRNTRILRLDAATGVVTGEWAYRFEKASEFETGAKPDDMKVSGLTWVGRDRLLVDERTDTSARIYAIDLRDGTDLLGGVYDDPATSPSLEQLDTATAFREAGVAPAPKTLVVDLSGLEGVPGKLEGIALVSRRTLAVISDNDFGMEDSLSVFDAAGTLKNGGDGTGIETRIAYVKLPRPIE